MNAKPRGGADNPAGRFRSGAMASRAREPPRGGPTAVAVGNDGDMEARRGKRRRPDRGDSLHSHRSHGGAHSLSRRKCCKLLYITKCEDKKIFHSALAS